MSETTPHQQPIQTATSAPAAAAIAGGPAARRRTRLAVAALALCCVWWGFSFPTMKVAMAAFERHLPHNASAAARSAEIAANATFIGWRFALAAVLYGQQGPSTVLHRGPVHAFSQRDGHHLLSLALPFARREEISLEQVDDRLIVQLAGRRRTIPLPQEVRYLEALSSSFDGQTLNVTFGRNRAGENAR